MFRRLLDIGMWERSQGKKKKTKRNNNNNNENWNTSGAKWIVSITSLLIIAFFFSSHHSKAKQMFTWKKQKTTNKLERNEQKLHRKKNTCIKGNSERQMKSERKYSNEKSNDVLISVYATNKRKSFWTLASTENENQRENCMHSCILNYFERKKWTIKEKFVSWIPVCQSELTILADINYIKLPITRCRARKDFRHKIGDATMAHKKRTKKTTRNITCNGVQVCQKLQYRLSQALPVLNLLNFTFHFWIKNACAKVTNVCHKHVQPLSIWIT